LGTTVSFPIPLASAIPLTNVHYTGVSMPVPHCSGPGHADPGNLCFYEFNSGGVSNPPDVFALEQFATTHGTGRFGFSMDWTVSSHNAFAIGSWTVTEP
jgi:hypothetical protein